jgi:hypothetical protein
VTIVSAVRTLYQIASIPIIIAKKKKKKTSTDDITLIMRASPFLMHTGNAEDTLFGDTLIMVLVRTNIN